MLQFNSENQKILHAKKIWWQWKIIFSASYHWWVQFLSFLLFPLILFLGFYFVVAPDEKISNYAPLIYVAVIASGIISLMEFLTIKRVLTTQRLIIKHGIFWRTQEIAIAELEEASLRQSPLGKMFGYGTIIVAGMGRVNITMRYVRTPLEFMKELNKLQSVWITRIRNSFFGCFWTMHYSF